MIPIPESEMEAKSFFPLVETLTVIPPLYVNLAAFPIKLNSTCLNLFLSEKIYCGVDSLIDTCKCKLLDSIWKRMMSQTSSTASPTSKFSFINVNLLFSILLRSRASSMTLSRWSAAFKTSFRRLASL